MVSMNNNGLKDQQWSQWSTNGKIELKFYKGMIKNRTSCHNRPDLLTSCFNVMLPPITSSALPSWGNNRNQFWNLTTDSWVWWDRESWVNRLVMVKMERIVNKIQEKGIPDDQGEGILMNSRRKFWMIKGKEFQWTREGNSRWSRVGNSWRSMEFPIIIFIFFIYSFINILTEKKTINSLKRSLRCW